MPANAFEELQWRGLVFDCIEGVQNLLATQTVTVYNGFDVTADSLHIGHLVPLLALARLQRYGHHPIAVAGGGTTMIGDPSGKSSERPLLSRQQIEENAEAIKGQLARFLDFDSKTNPARLVNNADWLLPLNLIDFLRDIGKHFTVNYMIAKDSVRARLEREEGISFTEFSYMLLQSYDFLHLYRTYGCLLQTGGSDQWGNITAGVELIRRVTGGTAYGLVYPLITKADGSKFGKTESGAVWLDPRRTSPYRFYQFWLNTDDRDVIHYLKVFTFLTQPEIEELQHALEEKPEQRDAQRTLARVMTGMLHGETALARAEQAAQVLFGGAVEGLSAAEIEDIFADVPSARLNKDQFSGTGLNIVDLLVGSGMMKSRGEARRAIGEGGIYLNNHRVAESERLVTVNDLLEGRFLILRRGKKTYFLVEVVG
ncbi:tyrosyl-tRNA synthetase [Bellilinea caldifistulae]|uniref:Tyrosine--tRNA ligase n=1 Tax=Bellilinea caldifistulae TaxID=360411 RepID=A0A0P6X4T9_9CHLR|nr:tyrosine--tRNA ligase [Bellilinea caldifistulae]KPL78097.1 tyrosine--tRNA ligase [Bellilinea caldifistulae]GAP09186.1 tyrosyl-tRNA synthetase [Bellilinea caldifistulae]